MLPTHTPRPPPTPHTHTHARTQELNRDASFCLECVQDCAAYLTQHGSELAAELALANDANAGDIEVNASLNASLE